MTTIQHDDATTSASEQMREAGYRPVQIAAGLAYALDQGADTEDEIFTLAMSRILYTDEQLEDGARFGKR